MLNDILLAIGITTVIIGIFITVREKSSEQSYNNQNNYSEIEELHHEISYSLKNILNDSLNQIELKTEHAIQSIELKVAALKHETEENKESTRTKNKLITKHKDIYNLYTEGLSPREIAIKLNRGVGEVETIVSLLKLERDK